MTEASAYLLEMAKRIAAVYTDHPNARAAMVSGSVALGLSDFRSDIDMFIYYDEPLPTEEELTMARLKLTDQEPVWRIGDREDGGFAEAIRLNGIECQIGQQTISSLKASIASVREAFEIDTPEQKALSGILDGLPIFGEEVILELKALVADYPDALARAMIEKHLSFFQLWSYSVAMETRDTWLWQQRIVLEAAENLVFILAGLNKLYFTPFQLKRTGLFFSKMSILPLDFAERLEAMFCKDPLEAGAILRGLLAETLELVETHQPQIDTSRVRKLFAKEYKVWQPVSL